MLDKSIITITPAKPTNTPVSLMGVADSSRNNMPATMTPNKGAVALRIAAKPELIWLWPQTIRLKGKTLFNSPMVKNAIQMGVLLGIGSFNASTTSHNVIAASPTQRVTIVKGGKDSRAISAKKNDPPQSTDKVTSIAHSRRFIMVLTAVSMEVSVII